MLESPYCSKLYKCIGSFKRLGPLWSHTTKHRPLKIDKMFLILRIDNRRQSVICATLHCSLALIHTISYHIPKDSLYFSLSNHTNDVMIFRKLWILNHFFAFYFLNMDISLDSCVPELKFCIVGHKIPLEGSMSQIFYLGLSLYFMLKNG